MRTVYACAGAGRIELSACPESTARCYGMRMEAHRDFTTSEIASVVSITITASVTASIVYDWGFLNALRLGFGAIPSTFADHAQGTLHWLPWAILGQSVGFAFELFIRRLERGKTREEQLDGLPPKHWIRQIWRSSDFIPLIYILMFVTMFALIGELAAVILSAAFFFLWRWFSSWILSHDRVSASIGRFGKMCFILAPIIAVYAYTMGWTSALARYHSPSMMIELSSQPESVYPVIRLYEAGVLYRAPEALAFQQWSNVSSMRATNRPLIWYGLMFGRRDPPFPGGPPLIDQPIQ